MAIKSAAAPSCGGRSRGGDGEPERRRDADRHQGGQRPTPRSPLDLGKLVLIVVYYALGTWAYYRVDDDPEFQPPQPTESGSRVVDMATALIARETLEHAWQPDDPEFMPNGLLIHPAALQRGIQGALARFAIELEDQIGRTRGSSAADPDLGRARGLLNHSGSHSPPLAASICTAVRRTL